MKTKYNKPVWDHSLMGSIGNSVNPSGIGGRESFRQVSEFVDNTVYTDTEEVVYIECVECHKFFQGEFLDTGNLYCPFCGEVYSTPMIRPDKWTDEYIIPYVDDPFNDDIDS